MSCSCGASQEASDWKGIWEVQETFRKTLKVGVCGWGTKESGASLQLVQKAFCDQVQQGSELVCSCRPEHASLWISRGDAQVSWVENKIALTVIQIKLAGLAPVTLHISLSHLSQTHSTKFDHHVQIPPFWVIGYLTSCPLLRPSFFYDLCSVLLNSLRSLLHAFFPIMSSMTAFQDITAPTTSPPSPLPASLFPIALPTLNR